MNKQFAQDVIEGLNATPKTLSSKYFYDEKGDAIFQQIMNLDEYYLTRSEYSIFDLHKDQMLKIFNAGVESFNLIEFGAGDGYKTKVLLKEFLKKETDFKYMPIDISGHVLDELEGALKKDLPELKVKPLQNDYFKALSELDNSKTRKVVLFLGSNIGNFSEEQAVQFLTELNQVLRKGDLVMIGFDLKKDPNVILNAYNDKNGVTRSFNLNLLNRINEELNGNFDISKFQHFPTYDPLSGTTASYLISKEKQRVEILDQSIEFEAWEAIHMEVSQKYDSLDIESMASQADFTVVNNFYDSNKYFVNSIWKK